jgi:hypothetical protein
MLLPLLPLLLRLLLLGLLLLLWSLLSAAWMFGVRYVLYTCDDTRWRHFACLYSGTGLLQLLCTRLLLQLRSR